MDDFEHALEKENAKLRDQLERAHDWCDGQGIAPAEDIGARLAPWVEEQWRTRRMTEEENGHLRAEVSQLNSYVRRGIDDEAALRAEVERLTRDRDEAIGEARDFQHALDEERARADANTASFDRMLTDRDDWRARAEAAEAECLRLQEWDRDVRLTQLRAAEERVEVAEADSAEYIRALNLVENDIADGRPYDAQRRAVEVLMKDHPGDALLERLRAAEKVVEAGRYYLNYVYEDGALNSALAAYDALKGGK